MWHVGGHNTITGDYTGKGEVLAFFARLAQETGGLSARRSTTCWRTMSTWSHSFTSPAGRNGKELKENGVQIFAVDGGQVVDAWFHPADQYADDEFWS